MMDCQHARLLLEFARPSTRELEPSEANQLQDHLRECSQCAHAAEMERHVDNTVGRAMRAVPVPLGLRERLLKRVSAERDAWYRKWLVRGVAVAAALILAVWLGHAWWSSRLPGVDWATVKNDQELRDAAQVEDWYHLRRVSMAAPPGFNYEFLNAYGISLFQGQHVPHLVFVAPERDRTPATITHVYVLSDRQFDLKVTERTMALKEVYLPDSVALIKHPEHPHFLFLVIATPIRRAVQ